MKRYHAVTWFTLGTCGTVLLLNNLFREPLYELGVEMIARMQQQSNKFMEYFFLLITMVIDPIVVMAASIAILVASKAKAQILNLFVFILFNAYLAALLKALDCDPRPFWTSSNVQSLGLYCPLEYGNPSGHSWFSAIFGFGVLLNYFGCGKYYTNIWISIAVVILMSISRMYLGAHSLNQVLEGLCLGLSMCVLYTTKLRKVLKQYLQNFNENIYYKLAVILLQILAVVGFLAHRFDLAPPDWQANIQAKCKTGLDQQKLNGIMLIANTVLVGLMTGIGIGYSGMKHQSYYMQGKWQINQQKYEIKCGYFYYILIQIALMFSGVIGGGLIYILSQHNLIVGALAMGLGGILSGYLYTAKSASIIFSIKLIVQAK